MSYEHEYQIPSTEYRVHELLAPEPRGPKALGRAEYGSRLCGCPITQQHVKDYAVTPVVEIDRSLTTCGRHERDHGTIGHR